MSSLQVIVFLIAIPLLLIAAYLTLLVVVEEVRSWFRPGEDLMRTVWRDRHGPYSRRNQ